MKNTRKIVSLSLATCIALSPFMVSADNKVGDEAISPISISVEENNKKEIEKDYIEYRGKIVSINKTEKSLSILVKDKEKEEHNGQLFHINEEVILLNHKTREIIKSDSLKEGMIIRAFYNKGTPVALSLPPQLTPDVIVVDEGEEAGFIYVSNFDDEYLSTDGNLKLNISEDTIIVDKNGEKVEDIKNKDLIVFYTITTRSLPPQTIPEKIIVMDKEDTENNTVTILDKSVIDGKELTLKNNMYINEKGVTMIPLREISEALGYEVKWNNKTQSTEVIKGAQWTSITIGKDKYNFAKMSINLGTAPEIKNSNTYVPVDFLVEVLKVGITITEKGILELGQ